MALTHLEETIESSSVSEAAQSTTEGPVKVATEEDQLFERVAAKTYLTRRCSLNVTSEGVRRILVAMTIFFCLAACLL